MLIFGEKVRVRRHLEYLHTLGYTILISYETPRIFCIFTFPVEIELTYRNETPTLFSTIWQLNKC